MQRTKKQGIVFGLLMSYIMAYGMEVYNVAIKQGFNLNVGGFSTMTNHVFVDAAIEASYMGAFVFITSSLWGNRIGAAFAKRHTDPAKDNPYFCRIMRQAGLHLAQLQGGHTPQDAEAIGPHRIIHRLRVDSVRSAAAVQEEIRRWAPYCRAFLVEAENAALLAELEFPRPWILSVRMDPAQLEHALELCRPDGVDFDSCVEAAPGIKSPRRLLQAMRTVRA